MESRAVNFPKGASYGDVHVELNRAWEYVAPGVWRSISLGGEVDWDGVNDKPDSFPPSDHKHPIDDVTGLQDALDAEAEARGDKDKLLDLRIDAIEDSIVDDGGFIDAPNDGRLYGRQSENWAEVPDGGVSDWADIENKPSTFPPEDHNHQIGDVDGLQDALDNAGGGVGGVLISDTEPSDPEDGMMWLDSTTAIVWVWDEDKWLEFPAGGGSLEAGEIDLPEMTSDPVANTLVLRDGNANAKFNLMTAKSFTYSQPTISRNTADTWFLSGGEASPNGVKKNDAEGMRASLNVYSKDESDALDDAPDDGQLYVRNGDSWEALPPMNDTYTGTNPSLVIRNEHGNSKFQWFTAHGMTFTGQVRDTPNDTFVLSGGADGSKDVFRTSIESFRESMDVYSKDEVDALSGGGLPGGAEEGSLLTWQSGEWKPSEKFTLSEYWTNEINANDSGITLAATGNETKLKLTSNGFEFSHGYEPARVWIKKNDYEDDPSELHVDQVFASEYLDADGNPLIWKGTQAEYDALTPNENTLYFIV